MPGLWDDVVWPGQDGYGLRTSDAAVGAVDDLGDLAVVGEAMVRRGIAVVRAVTALRTGGKASMVNLCVNTSPCESAGARLRVTRF